MITISQNAELYEISSKYDPNLISIIKSIPGRKWVPENKIWTIPSDKLGWLLAAFRGTVYASDLNIISDEHLNEDRSLDSTRIIPETDISKVPLYVASGHNLYKHQIDFMKFAIDRQNHGNMNGFLLCDDPGAGKTLQAMNLAMYNKQYNNFKHCLIICCVNTSKYNWLQDITYHTDGIETPYILGARYKRDKHTVRYDTGCKERLEDLRTRSMYGSKGAQPLPYFIILNIESIRMRETKNYPIADEIINMINNGELNMIAIDEIHKNASPSSLQGKQLLRIKKYTKNNCMWLPITGTPIVNKPTDVYLPLRLINGHDYSNYYLWTQSFCIYGGYGDHEIIGYKNIDKLKRLLQYNMIRRLKSEILDLPPKIHYTEYIDNTAYQTKLYQDICKDMIEHSYEIIDSLNPLASFMKLRQVNGAPELVDKTLRIDNKYKSKNAKLCRLLELIGDIIDRNEKVVIYSNWIQPLRMLYRFLYPKYKICAYTGTMPDAQREAEKTKFINDASYKIMLGTLGALGTSHTLTVASNVIFYDEPWTPTDKCQGEDRCHRIGTNQPLKIYTLITRNTVDEKVHNLLYSKNQISSYIVDNNLDIRKNPDLFSFLMN